MKIAFVGKGGSGKTTMAALFAKHVSLLGCPVLAIDADINQHLGEALGLDQGHSSKLNVLGDHISFIKEYLRGDNRRIPTASSMIKTTPPGYGSRLLTVTGSNPIYDLLTTTIGGIRLAVTGGFAEDDLGVACYHSKVGAVELLLNHLVDNDSEYVVVDMVAGAEAFASGMFTRFDHTFLVCEPTIRSVSVFHQYLEYARGYDMAVSVVGNKVDDDADVAFLKAEVGDALLGCFSRSRYVKASERGVVGPIADCEPANRAVLSAIRDQADSTGQDWDKFTRLAHEFHLRNARAWANERAGIDLAEQIDPAFSMPSLAVSTSS